MSKEFVSEIQFPIEHVSIQMGFEAKPNPEEENKGNQEIFEKGLIEDSVNDSAKEVQDAITDDDQMIFVIERPDFVAPDSLLASQNPQPDCGVWEESSAQVVKKWWLTPELTLLMEWVLLKNVLSTFIKAKNVCENKSDGSKRRYTRNEMEELRFENSDQQRQIWREIYTGLGPIIAKELNCSAEDRQKSNANTVKRKQRRRKPKQHNQQLQQSQEHHQYQQQHQKHPQKPHQQAGVNVENASILGMCCHCYGETNPLANQHEE
ncbi:hypothetical protein C5167_025260 [Papaver somniferum]|uniref:Uncharacterized protein n=1 Tax=Papaver somniferum TaxID=3469 RepID=A0A4Y7JU88_PAPSO|nr:hypothetical protein C5167_025260 [Papaver somniferum]